jgi:hypothetical protein
MGIVLRMFAVSWALTAMSGAHAGSPALVTPTFKAQDSAIIYFRPVVNATGTTAIFEHTPTGGGMTTLFSLDLTTQNASPRPFITSVVATRADWCWNRSDRKIRQTAP